MLNLQVDVATMFAQFKLYIYAALLVAWLLSVGFTGYKSYNVGYKLGANTEHALCENDKGIMRKSIEDANRAIAALKQTWQDQYTAIENARAKDVKDAETTEFELQQKVKAYEYELQSKPENNLSCKPLTAADIERLRK